jgi:hypothetical protein
MAEDHSKYMPHHPRPKYAGGGKPKLRDTMLRARSEPTSHDGSMQAPPMGDYASQQTEPSSMGQQYYGGSPEAPM